MHDTTVYDVSNSASDIDQNLTDNLELITSAVTTIGDPILNGGTEIGAGNEAVSRSSHARPLRGKDTDCPHGDGNQLGGRSPVDAAADAAICRSRFTQLRSAAVVLAQTQMRAVAAAGGGIHYHVSHCECFAGRVSRDCSYTACPVDRIAFRPGRRSQRHRLTSLGEREHMIAAGALDQETIRSERAWLPWNSHSRHRSYLSSCCNDRVRSLQYDSARYRFRGLRRRSSAVLFLGDGR